MQFTMMHACGGPQPEIGFGYALWFSPLVVISLLLWLRRGARDAHDVLGAAAPSSRNSFSAFRDLLSWACVAAAFIGPLLFSMGFLIGAGALLEHVEQTGAGVDPTSWGWFAVMTLLFTLLRVKWLRSASSRWDVLRIA